MKLNDHQIVILLISAIMVMASIWIGFEFIEFVSENEVGVGEMIFSLSLQFTLLAFGFRYFLKAFLESGGRR